MSCPLSTLSSRLTKVAAYRQTICRIEAQDYLLRRIRGDEEPAVQSALQARQTMVASARRLIEILDWRDFEVLIDLIFAQSGWRRTSGVGGSDQADSDLVLEQAVSGERAIVQVKSKADLSVVRDYVQRFRRHGADRLFFVCHSLSGKLADEEPNVHIWSGDKLAQQALSAGLFDWLVKKAR